MLIKRYNKIVVGVLIFLLCTISTGVFAAPVSVSALVADYIAFIFDGRSQTLPEGYTVLMYESRTYVPARFVAEQLGAYVAWDGNTRTIGFTTAPCSDCTRLAGNVSKLEGEREELKRKINELEAKIATLEESKETRQPELNYRRLPLSKSLIDMNVEVKQLLDNDDYTRIYIALENKQRIPLQLLHRDTIAVVGGEEYKAADVSPHLADERWYHNINEDNLKEGYIIFPALPDDEENMLLTVTILYNEAAQKTIDLEFAIRY